jgi:hypothetical protein
MATNNKYGYEDIIDNSKGIFGSDCAGLCGSAMDAFSDAAAKPDQAGMLYEVTCENCGPRRIVVEWPELIAIKNQISPHIAFQRAPNLVRSPTAWGFDGRHQSWFPDIRCSSCNWQFRMMVSPGEVERGLRTAMSQGWITEPAYQQITGLCHQMKQAVAPAPRR